MDVSLLPKGYHIRVCIWRSEIVSFERQNIYLLFNYDIVNYLLRTNGSRERRAHLLFLYFGVL